MEVRHWLELQRNFLLILDAADDLSLYRSYGTTDPSDLESTIHPGSLLQYVPQSHSGTILWTSRDERILGSIVSANKGIAVGPMQQSEALELLQNLSGSLCTLSFDKCHFRPVLDATSDPKKEICSTHNRTLKRQNP